MKLRPYQSDAKEAVYEAFREHSAVLGVMATGCIAGDSVIGINRGGKGYSRKIEKAYEAQFDKRTSANVLTMVRSYVGERIGLHRTKNIVFSGMKLTYQLVLANGYSVRATEDHEIMTDNGFKPLGDLNGSDFVLCEALDVLPRRNPPKKQYRQIQGLRFHPYACRTIARRRGTEKRLYRVPLHRLVVEARMNGLPVEDMFHICAERSDLVPQLRFLDPGVYAVHHRDGDSLNNESSNLQAMTHEEHCRLHGHQDKWASLGKCLVTSSPFCRIDRCNEEPVYDVVCDDPHRNFVANGIVVHNCGKTVIFGEIIKHYVNHGRCLVLAHREELLEQATQKIQQIVGVRPEMEMADSWVNDSSVFGAPQIVVSTVQTQIAGWGDKRRMHRFDPNDFSLLVLDEAHHAISPSWMAVIEHYRQNEKLKVLGVTATPKRFDKKAMGSVFETVAFDYNIKDALDEGWLVPIRQKYITVEGLDFDQVGTTGGDFNSVDLARQMEAETPLHKIASSALEIAGARKTLVFCASVQQAEQITEILNRHNQGCARLVTGTTHKDVRRELIRDYRCGAFQFLVNVGVATEGFDVPDIQCIVMARPTKSAALYLQMLGRGTRPDARCIEGIESAHDRVQAIRSSLKPDVLIVDFVGNAGKHRIIHVADILGGKYTDEVIDLAKKRIAASALPDDVSEELRKAEREWVEQQRILEAEQRSRITAKTRWVAKDIDPFEVFEIVPTRNYGADEGRPVENWQREKLEKWRVPVPETFDAAQDLIDEFRARVRRGQCTYRQALMLKRYGYDSNMSFEQASKTMNKIFGKRPMVMRR